MHKNETAQMPLMLAAQTHPMRSIGAVKLFKSGNQLVTASIQVDVQGFASVMSEWSY